MKASNLERARWRRECRQLLAENIRARVGIDVEPDQVRLNPPPQAGYSWHYSSQKSHLFKTGLSKLSTGAYVELCEDIKKQVIKAVPRAELNLDEIEDASLEAKIAELEQKTVALRNEVSFWTTTAEQKTKELEAAKVVTQVVQQEVTEMHHRYHTLASRHKRLKIKMQYSQAQGMKAITELQKWHGLACKSPT